MKIKIRLLTSVLAAAALFGSVTASADDEAWGNSFRLGLYSVFYHTDASNLQGPFVPADVNFKAKNLETLYIGYVRRLSPSFAVELALGYPPLSKVEGRGAVTVGSVPYNGQVVASARWLSPTVLFEYNFLPESSKLRPYIGVGVNYTAFYDRVSNAQGNEAQGGPTRISLTSSVGPAGTVGLAWNVSGHWHLYTSYSISRVNTDLTSDTAGVERKARIKFGPQAWVLSAGYSF